MLVSVRKSRELLGVEEQRPCAWGQALLTDRKQRQRVGFLMENLSSSIVVTVGGAARGIERGYEKSIMAEELS